MIAIKGHTTRGEEIIKILEMLGGINLHDYNADCDSLCYYSEKSTDRISYIYYDWVNNCYEDMHVFTLEEFLEKYPYKVGDKIAQMVCLKYPTVELIEKNELSDTERGTNGFGSTDKKIITT